jgi:hypothetical protein
LGTDCESVRLPDELSFVVLPAGCLAMIYAELRRQLNDLRNAIV